MYMFIFTNKNLYRNIFKNSIRKYSNICQQYHYSSNITKNSYQILCIPTTSTDEQIKFAYLEMVKKYHPDLNSGSNTLQKFKEIQLAYQQISQIDKRKQYDKKNNIQVKIVDTVKMQQFIDKFHTNFKRKDRVPEQLRFSYNLFKQHHDKIQQKKTQYQRFPGDYEQYYVHKDQQPQSPFKKIAMVIGSIGICVGALYYVNL